VALITATPVLAAPDGLAELEDLVEKLYGVNPGHKTDVLAAGNGGAGPVIDFLETETQLALRGAWVSEIADNPGGSLRAFTACDPLACQEKLYLESMESGVTWLVDWSGRLPAWPVSRIVWIGDNRLAFFQLTSAYQGVVGVVDIRAEKFVIYWLVEYP
jgi:hypothetical protein